MDPDLEKALAKRLETVKLEEQVSQESGSSQNVVKLSLEIHTFPRGRLQMLDSLPSLAQKPFLDKERWSISSLSFFFIAPSIHFLCVSEISLLTLPCWIRPVSCDAE
jgi:hypothetical protein